jgi:predicted house-cleaning NTP pyrophosphatase (Maf/HAM1 superfamily)
VHSVRIFRYIAVVLKFISAAALQKKIVDNSKVKIIFFSSFPNIQLIHLHIKSYLQPSAAVQCKAGGYKLEGIDQFFILEG